MSSLRKARRLRWLVAACVLGAVTALIVVAQIARWPMPDFLRHLLEVFVQPGTIVWWMAMGTLFNGYPGTATDVAVIALANAAVWLPVFWVVRSIRARLGPGGT